jgi:DNA polymerase I-like protein with 3'-5' exonuclease and polymerase domains
MWAEPLEFKLSKKSLISYQKSLMHHAIRSRKENKVTFDEKAILQLVKKYKNDPLYPLILEHRSTQKLLSTYVGTTQPNGRIKGGIPIAADGRVHTTFTSNPSTLRSASQKPNLQNIPRPNGSDQNDPANLIRNFFKAKDGYILTARDFSGIEAKLVGYFANDPDYMRLCAIDVHSFYTAHAVSALDGRIKPYDLPDLSWDDIRLTEYLAHIKKNFKADRNNLYKHLVHAANFGQKERGATEKIFLETGIAYPVETIKRVMDIYYELFPKIKKWHWSALLQVESDGFLKNPFGYVHRFSRAMDYEWINGKCHKSPGVDANKVWAFLPQSTAAGIIKEAMLRLFFNRYEEAGQYLRLLIHDELFSECPIDIVDKVDAIVQEEMERPIQCMPLPDSYNMGSHLIVGTEGKKGYRWGQMK